jgi:hypothetical protein
MNSPLVAPAAEISLDPHELLATARANTGLQNFGHDESWRVGFNHLLASVADMQAPPVLRASARRSVLHSLETRLRLTEDARLHPEIVAQQIEKPIIVIGLPRTGTTISYDLLALDPRARAPCEWEWYIPWPATDAATFNTDPRIAIVQSMYQNWLDHAPELLQIQRFDCTQPGECNHGMCHHFASTNFWAELGVPRFSRWLQEAVPEGQYRTHRRLLQEFQWRGPKGNWILKSPQHLFDLDGLLEAYPDACLVWTHRDPVSTLSSLASMVSKFQRATGGGKDLKAVGRSVVDMWSAAMARGTRSRETNPQVERAIIDLAHRDVVHDPVAAMRRIYERFDLEFSAAHVDRIQRFLQESRSAQRLGQHRHDPAEFGIDADEVHMRLAGYYARFGHLLAKA